MHFAISSYLSFGRLKNLVLQYFLQHKNLQRCGVGLQTMVWSNVDILKCIHDYLNMEDIVSLSQTCKRINALMKSSLLRDSLFISNTNLQVVLNMPRMNTEYIRTVTIVGEFNKKERKQLQQLWRQLTPSYFVLDSNVADFENFYSYPSLFSELRTLEARNGSFEYIDIDKFTYLQTVVIVNHDNHDAHLRIKSYSNITRLVLRDCVFVPHSELSDYIFSGRHAPASSQVAETRTMPYLTHLISHNAVVKQETMPLNASLMSNAPLWIPNIVLMDLIDHTETNSVFGYLADFKHIRYFSYECKAIQGFNTFPICSTLKSLRLKALDIELTENFESLNINSITIICSQLEYSHKLLPKNRYLNIKHKTKQIVKMNNNWYFNDSNWYMTDLDNIYSAFP